MPIEHDPMLVALSLLVAIQASFVGLSLALRVSQAFAFHRRLLIAGAALSFAIGIWAMHFVGMLAARLPVSVDYVVLPTLLSFLICVLVVGVAVYLATLRSQRMLFIAATVMGLGIASMHYIGMMALHVSVHMIHNPVYVLASVVIAILASSLALWLAFASDARPPLILCAAVLGCAISGMHYTAMAGLTLHPIVGEGVRSAPAISGDLLAVIVSIVAFVVSGGFMLALVPDQSESGTDFIKWTTTPKAVASTSSVDLAITDACVQLSTTTEEVLAEKTPDQLASAVIGGELTLPIEKYGSAKKINIADIFSVHANAHYTYVFNGREDIFCPLSISEIVERLPSDIFFRVHRSYIISIPHVVRLKRAGDNGVADLDSPVRRSVPVSRSRLPQLRAQLTNYLQTQEN
ncbi:MAG: LytTR family transcriptional regulator DNA-binding domain-containing protein [Afipia sp.]|nr:LytTR family transcriptional regulator DNA-binding domain-containing protein [Afipia sp.]